MNNNQNGKLAEFAAIAYFLTHGYSIVKHNYITGRGTGAGEIDLIVKKQNLLVFVEVKKRNSLEKAAYAILPAQQQRIWKAAENFIQNHPEFSEFDIRFDAFLYCSAFNFQHISDAWRSW